MINVLKGISILAVVLYHLGFVKTGYLGVDVFFVINGFLIIPGVMKKIEEKTFSCKEFLVRRFSRLFPLLVLGCVVSLLVGYIGMLPDDYENLGQSVVASLLFSNNLLAAITTKDYWNIVNEYKPLMHTWYLGILMEFYVIIVCLCLFGRVVERLVSVATKNKIAATAGKIVTAESKKVTVESKPATAKSKITAAKVMMISMVALTAISLVLYLLPGIGEGYKFYFIFFRFFEISLGGFVGILAEKKCAFAFMRTKWFSGVVTVLLTGVLFLSFLAGQKVDTSVVPIGGVPAVPDVVLPSGNVLLLLTVALTCVALWNADVWKQEKVLSYLGKRSYSLFMWHQILIAFYRYFVAKNISVGAFILYCAVLLLLSECTYRLVETKKLSGKKHAGKAPIAIGAVACAAMGASLLIYINAGVVRDVPELDITMDNVHRGMHAEYVERVYGYDMDFPADNGKVNVLVIGNSFARDWANVLLESDMADSMNLSYSFDFYDTEQLKNRIRQCDYLFCFGQKEIVPDFVWENVQDETRVWGIGTKNFGECNGIIYSKQFSENYYKQTARMIDGYAEVNEQLKSSWGERYIDLMQYVRGEDGRVRVFSKDQKFLSQDGLHLTKSGAEYYAGEIGFEAIFGDLGD